MCGPAYSRPRGELAEPVILTGHFWAVRWCAKRCLNCLTATPVREGRAAEKTTNRPAYKLHHVLASRRQSGGALRKYRASRGPSQGLFSG